MRTKLAEGPARAEAGDAGSVIFLFLSELFLIPHLLPIAAALARLPAPPRITLLVISSIHEEIAIEALAKLGIANVAIRRARGFRRLPPGNRETPALPPKLLTLARNALAILRNDVAVVAERTSLWLPGVVRVGARFVYNEHGAGPHANFASPRNRFAARILMPGGGMAERVRSGGHPEAPIETVGYIKRDYIREISGSGALPAFAETRPTVIYVPHWLRCKSSWWKAGEQVLDHFARSATHNLILAPHIRLPRADPDFAARIAPYRSCPNIHIDATSFRLVDQSYTNGADIYLGDGSSQVLEFAERPRPAIFLNPDRLDWQNRSCFSHWRMGDVIGSVAELGAALANASTAHRVYAPIQRAYVERMMGGDDGRASQRAARVIVAVIAERRAGGASFAKPSAFTPRPAPAPSR